MVCSITSQLILLTLVVSHPVPDGLVFRGIQVVVHSEKLEIRYQVGLSDSMIRRELAGAVEGGAGVSEMGGVEALARYRDMMFPLLPRRLKVAIEGRAVEVGLQRADIVRQPHAQLEFVYEVAVPLTDEPQRFDLLDENYSGVPGYHLAAMRGRGTVQVVPAGTEELYSRLPRIPEVEDETAPPLRSVRKISAYIRTTGPELAPSGSGAGASTSDPTLAARDPDTARTEMVAEQGERSSVGESLDISKTSPPQADTGVPRGSLLGPSLGRILWCVGFGGLAVLIAWAWLKSSRPGRGC
jgi:hypothetical protein